MIMAKMHHVLELLRAINISGLVPVFTIHILLILSDLLLLILDKFLTLYNAMIGELCRF